MATVPSPHRRRPPQPPKKTARPTGPRYLHLDRAPGQRGGPGPAPASFTGSAPEWVIHWVLTKLLGPVGIAWLFQAKVAGGRKRKGGAVPDFLIRNRTPELILRVITSRFHIAVGSERHAYDVEQKRALERLGFQVIDLFDEHFLKENDFATGQAAIAVVWEALKGVQRPNPITTGTSIARG